MPSWSKNDREMYEAIRDSYEERGRDEETAEEIAARTVNKHRREEGRTPNETTQGTGNPNDRYEDRTKDELYNLAQEMHIQGRSKMDKRELIRAIREERS